MNGDKFDFAEVEISITQAHIDKGVASDCTRCPGALAMLEQIPDIEAIDVDDLRIVFVTTMGRRVRVEPPRELVEFIIAFDDGKKPGPVKFKIRNPLDL